MRLPGPRPPLLSLRDFFVMSSKTLTGILSMAPGAVPGLLHGAGQIIDLTAFDDISMAARV